MSLCRDHFLIGYLLMFNFNGAPKMKQKNNKKKNGFEKINFIFFVFLMGISSCLYGQIDNKTKILPTTAKTSVHHNKFSSFSESELE